MNADLLSRARAWRDADPDPETAREVDRLAEAGDEAALEDRFRSELEFGTAGLRGLLGAGPNRMNRAVVRRATAGVARHLLATVPDAARRGVVVARDARPGSPSPPGPSPRSPSRRQESSPATASASTSSSTAPQRPSAPSP